MGNFSILEEDLKSLEKEILAPEGYELYDFGGNNFVITNVYTGKDDKTHPIEGTTLTNLIAIYKQKKGKQCVFSTFELDPENYNTEDIAAAFRKAIAEGREKYPDLA